MTDEPPTPPTELPTDIVDRLNEVSPDRLYQVASYAEELAAYRERQAHMGEDGDDSEDVDQSDDRPDTVPSKATITIKEINDNRYYYWQWREGDSIRSEYKGPVGSDP